MATSIFEKFDQEKFLQILSFEDKKGDVFLEW